MLCVCDYRPNKSLSKDVRNTFYLLRKNRFNIWLWIRGNYLTNRKDPLMYQRCNFTNDCRTYFRQPQSENKCFERFYSTKTTYIKYQKVVAFILLPRCEKKKNRHMLWQLEGDLQQTSDRRSLHFVAAL